MRITESHLRRFVRATILEESKDKGFNWVYRGLVVKTDKDEDNDKVLNSDVEALQKALGDEYFVVPNNDNDFSKHVIDKKQHGEDIVVINMATRVNNETGARRLVFKQVKGSADDQIYGELILKKEHS